MSAERVSCVVPVFDGERYLAEALESVFAQTHPAAEVIVVDDGSTDGTAGVIRGFGDRVIAASQRNAGPAAARNAGIARATGEFVSFLDSDDLWRPDRLERAIARFRARPELDFCVCHAENFVSSELTRTPVAEPPQPGYVAGGLVVRSAAFARLGPLDAARRHSDVVDWVLRARGAGAVDELLPDVLLRRRLHRGNLSQRAAVGSHDEFLAVVKAHLDRRRAAR